jgi:hypothetical protein
VNHISSAWVTNKQQQVKQQLSDSSSTGVVITDSRVAVLPALPITYDECVNGAW